MSTDQPDEHDALLPNEETATLPRSQLFVLMYMRLAEPIAFQIPFPFVNQMVEDLGIASDPAAVGYYSGLIESSFAITQLLFIYHWSRLSDRLGRRPILICGLLGVSLSVALFGLSTSLLGMIAARCCAGMLNGNPAVIKAALGEISSKSNEGQVFAWLATMSTIGSAVGTLLGGQLQNPAARFPCLQHINFLVQYPYFLPCFVGALVPLSGSILGLLYLEETLPSKRGQATHTSRNDSESAPLVAKPAPKTSVLKDGRVLRVLGSYTGMVILITASFALIPLFTYTPVKDRGLGLSPSAIGNILSLQAVIGIIWQVAAFPPLQRHYGTVSLYKRLALFFPAGAIFFALASAANESKLVWVVFVSAVCCITIGQTSFITAMLTVNNISSDPNTLGALNGLAQMCSSFAKAVAPWSTTSLFAFSTAHGGWLIWVALGSLSLVSAMLTWTLPEL